MFKDYEFTIDRALPVQGSISFAAPDQLKVNIKSAVRVQGNINLAQPDQELVRLTRLLNFNVLHVMIIGVIWLAAEADT